MKKMYVAPTLTTHGDIRDVTRGRGWEWHYDGGLDFFSRDSGGGGPSAS